MTLHPTHLHALAELHSLAAAWPPLLRAVEAAAAAEREDVDRGTLRSPGWSSGRSGGGYSNAVLDAVTHTRVDRSYAKVLDSAVMTIAWLTDTLLGHEPNTSPEMNIVLLRVRVPKLRTDAAGRLAAWVAEVDGKVRAAAGLVSDHELLTGATCPACGVRRIAVRTSTPDVDARPYVCEAGCVCAGEGCPCGMAVPAAGVRHIWLRADLVAAIRGRGDER